MLSEQWIICFLEVVRTGSFTKAANELYLTQQAVSKHVKRLEAELGHLLFSHSTRKVELTEIGQEYYQMFLKWQYDYENIKKKAEQMDQAETRLRIGMIQRMNTGKIPMIVQQVRRQHPEYTVQIIHSDAAALNRKLNEGELDIIITYKDFVKEDKSLIVKEFGRTRLMLALAANHDLAGGEFAFSRLKNEPFLVCINKGESRQAALERALREREQYGLGDGPVRLYGEIDEVNLRTELGEGFSFCSTTNLFAKNPFIKCYPLPKVTVICGVWKKNMASKPLKAFLTCASEQGDEKELLSEEGWERQVQ